MTQNLAYEIGAVFLVVACLMWASSARALIPEEIRGAVKLAAIVAALVSCGIAAYQIIPAIRWTPSPGPVRTTQEAPAKAAAHSVTPKQPKAPSPFVGKVSQVEYILKVEPKEPAGPTAPTAVTDDKGTPTAELAVPDAAANSPDVPAPGADQVSTPGARSRPKRWIQSTKRLLHLGQRKYEPAQAVPQPQTNSREP